MRYPLFHLFNLHEGEEAQEKVLENVRSNVSFRGSNLWILACAIVVASVGLNVNSPAVVIGAMLISPLMGPIVGAGFALGTYDFDLLRRSLKNLLIATTLSMAVATLYFFLSPFKDTQSELLARTAPTIYDVIVAFFGGLVGVIAFTRVEKGNPIPGVAIATALMPPLCTAGYGLAIGNVNYFLGAFYLYSINCFFICVATFFIVKYLKYTPAQYVNQRLEKQIRYGISVLILVMMVPSFYLAYRLYTENRHQHRVEKFVQEEFIRKGYTVIHQQIVSRAKAQKVELALLNAPFNKGEVATFERKLKDYGLDHTKLVILQDTRDLKAEILQEINRQQQVQTVRNQMLDSLQQELNTYKLEDTLILQELAILFPQVHGLSLGRHLENMHTDSACSAVVLVYRSAAELPVDDRTRLENWLKQKYATNRARVLRG
jgi:uncharacterized hydrophobic protein (TIGR00271 family)